MVVQCVCVENGRNIKSRDNLPVGNSATHQSDPYNKEKKKKVYSNRAISSVRVNIIVVPYFVMIHWKRWK